ncbi:hypothetical protein LAUMK13_00425 [Mycobacterium innocens]|uniref:Acyl-CoA dehydrogenase/oxidase N-terminal domain-containing protein n=1 Tax=Mycobacterium innocens TaxID=2341083 RepID=A0A498PQP3_9MYCO|nr:hypothetical protein LAUMK13_00425 [Mycobacterium innocens]
MSTDPPPAFDRYDPLGLDASLSADEFAVRDTYADSAPSTLTPFVAEWFEDGDLPVARELAKQFGQLGLLGMHLHAYGCGGSSAVHYDLACLELEAATSWSSATPSPAWRHSADPVPAQAGGPMVQPGPLVESGPPWAPGQ